MMYGLPLQTAESISKGLEQAISLSPSRFAIFGYAHVPWMKQHQKLLEKYTLPDGLTRFGMNELMRGIVTQAGYQAIGIDHFALGNDSLSKAYKSGRLHRNFQGYTDDPAETIIGLGVSSITSFPDAYIQMATNIRAYREKLAAGVLPVTRGRILTADDRERRALIGQLMCYFELDLDKTGARKKLSGAATAKLAELQKDGLIEMKDSVLRITETGKPFARVVSACFDTYYDVEKKQHARAV
jgi:oxygen-independent coproporphyrinogen-3 oxidase